MAKKTPSSPCPCQGIGLGRFLHAAILVQLAQGERHGYEILARLDAAGGYKPDAAGIYRTLKNLEEGGYCRSRAVAGDGGRRKRRYRITAAGRTCLEKWVVTLDAHRRQLGRLLRDGRRVLGS